MAATATAFRSRGGSYLALNRNVTAVASIIAVMTFGESLSKRFLAKYFRKARRSSCSDRPFGTTEDFLDVVYRYPRRWQDDRLGRRAALLIWHGRRGRCSLATGVAR